MGAYDPPKTQTLTSVPCSLLAEVSLQCVLRCVYRCITHVLWERLRDRHSGKVPTLARCSLSILVLQ